MLCRLPSSSSCWRAAPVLARFSSRSPQGALRPSNIRVSALGSTSQRGNSPGTRRWATSTTPHSVAADPAEAEALSCLEQGTQKLEEGDVESAKKFYKRSVEIRRSASSLFNLGVTHYHLKEFDQAIEAWKECIILSPNSADAHTKVPTLLKTPVVIVFHATDLASAYIISPVTPRPDLALHHLRIASELSPEDPEIAFNLAAVLEACGHLEDSLLQYKRSKKFGVEKAAVHIRNVSAKILGKQLDQEKDPAPGEKT